MNNMDESILESVKKILGLTNEYNVFDQDLIMHINSVLMGLYQIGIGKKDFFIDSEVQLWSDFLNEDESNFHAIKSFVALKTRMNFDPPASSILKEAINEQLKEFEWRLSVAPSINK